MKTLIYLFIFILCIQSALANSPEHLIMCRKDKTVRTLRVEKKTNGRCYAFYTKAGVDQGIGNAMKQDICLDLVNQVKATLEKAEWQCKVVTGSTTSSLNENIN